jgi:hypothetical protein
MGLRLPKQVDMHCRLYNAEHVTGVRAMMTVVLAFLFMLAIVAAMSIGVVMGRKPIAGSCGGLKALGIDGRCEICGGTPDACEGGDTGLSKIPEARRRAASLASDAADSPAPGNVRTL